MISSESIVEQLRQVLSCLFCFNDPTVVVRDLERGEWGEVRIDALVYGAPVVFWTCARTTEDPEDLTFRFQWGDEFCFPMDELPGALLQHLAESLDEAVSEIQSLNSSTAFAALRAGEFDG